MTIRRAILGLAVSVNLILLSAALPVNHGSALPSQASPQLVAMAFRCRRRIHRHRRKREFALRPRNRSSSINSSPPLNSSSIYLEVT